jgi:hypothetical protein
MQGRGQHPRRKDTVMWSKPIVEIRVEEYTRGTLPRYLAAQKALALPLQERIIGTPMAYYTSLVGRINCAIQLWGYESVAAYAEQRAAVEADPDWAAYRDATQDITRFTTTRLTRQVMFDGADEGAAQARAKPVVDFRVYHIHNNQMGTFLDTSAEFALPDMMRNIGAPIGYFQTIVGNLNEITHLWGYDSLGDMEARRDKRNADPDWRAYLDASDGIYHRQETQVLRKIEL